MSGLLVRLMIQGALQEAPLGLQLDETPELAQEWFPQSVLFDVSLACVFIILWFFIYLW